MKSLVWPFHQNELKSFKKLVHFKCCWHSGCALRSEHKSVYLNRNICNMVSKLNSGDICFRVFKQFVMLPNSMSNQVLSNTFFLILSNTIFLIFLILATPILFNSFVVKMTSPKLSHLQGNKSFSFL